MTINSNHTLRELQQVNMLLKKIVKKSDTSPSFEHQINEFEQVIMISKKMLNNLPQDDNKISPGLLEKIHNDLKTPLTPVKAYVQLFLSGHLGEFTAAQKQKLQIISDNLKELECIIKKLF